MLNLPLHFQTRQTEDYLCWLLFETIYSPLLQRSSPTVPVNQRFVLLPHMHRVLLQRVRVLAEERKYSVQSVQAIHIWMIIAEKESMFGAGKSRIFADR